MLIPTVKRLRPIFPNLMNPWFCLFWIFLAGFPSGTSGQAEVQTFEPAKLIQPGIAAQSDSFCGATFFKRLFIPGQNTAGYKIMAAPNETFLLGASVDDYTLIVRTDKNMNVLWAQSIDMAPGFDVINDMRLDSDGQIIGVGNASALGVWCYAFKIDASDGQLKWRSILNDPDNCYFTRILEKNAGSNYLLFGQSDALINTFHGCDAMVMEIDRNTGELVWDRHFNLGNCDIFDEVFIRNNNIYACGRHTLPGGGHDSYRAALTRMDLAGNLQWSRCYIRNGNEVAHLYTNALQPDGDSIVIAGWGNDNVVSLTATTLQLLKTDSTGAIAWAKKYDIAGGNEERSYRLIIRPDGYLLCGFFLRPNPAGREFYIIKTAKNGDYLWGKSYGSNGEDGFRDIILLSDTLYLTGRTPGGFGSDILIGKLDLDGNLEGPCDFVRNLDVVVSDYPTPFDGLQPLAPVNIPNNYAAAAPADGVPVNLTTEAICQKICDTPPEEAACDVKTTPCVKFEILGIFQNPAKQRTYRMRITNFCADKLLYVIFQLPNGIIADKPTTNTIYTTPGGRQYEVRNPNSSPAHSIRFKTIGDGMANGQSDIFEYTLPPQSEPLFIHAAAKLFPQLYFETHLNVFDCSVQQTVFKPEEAVDRKTIPNPGQKGIEIFPNPVMDVLKVRIPEWNDQIVQLHIADLYGRLLYQQTVNMESVLLTLDLPATWPAGVYFIETLNGRGERHTTRFALTR